MVHLPERVSFYCVSETTEKLERLAQHAVRIAGLVKRYRREEPEEIGQVMTADDINDFIQTELIAYAGEESDRYSWLAQDFLMRDIARWIARNDFPAFNTFLRQHREYIRCFGSVGRLKQHSARKQAAVHVLAACIILSRTFDRDQVTKAKVRRLASDLWKAGYRLYYGKIPFGNGKLPAVQWRRIYRTLGLDDLRTDSTSKCFRPFVPAI